MGRATRGAIFAILMVATASCSTAPSVKPSPSSDIADARPLAREVANTLLTIAAYDYAVVGAINGDRVRAVSTDRYAAVARAQATQIGDTSTKIVAAVIDTGGPVHDRMVTLADALADLRRDLLAYSDLRDAASLARVVGDVDKDWGLLRSVQSLLKDDAALDRAITRGTSIKTTVAPGRQAVVTIGPFAGPDEAAEQARAIGTNAVAATASPFVVRVTYPDRAAADNVAKALQKQGYAAIVIDQTAYAFTRMGASPDAELWREPERYIDTHAGARRVAISADAGLIATGADDGFISIYTNDGVLRSLPKFNAGVNQLVFTDDGRFLFGGGQLMVTWVMPRPTFYVGEPMRLQGAAISAVFVPKAYAFAASSAGVVGGRAPDGAVLPSPFPIDTGSSGAILDASDNGELFIAMQVPQGFEVDVLAVGRDSSPRGILRVPGTGRAFAVDRSGGWGAAVTDQGTYRFSLKAAEPSKTVTRLAAPVRDVEFGHDGTLYLLDAKSLTAVGADGTTRWSQALVDGRRMAAGLRTVVLDGTDTLYAFAPQDGTKDPLAAVGTIQDLVASRDGNWIAVVADARRAVLFRLQ